MILSLRPECATSQKKTTKIKWKMTEMEDGRNGRKAAEMEGRRPKCKEGGQNGRKAAENSRWPTKPNSIQMSFICELNKIIKQFENR